MNYTLVIAESEQASQQLATVTQNLAKGKEINLLNTPTSASQLLVGDSQGMPI